MFNIQMYSVYMSEMMQNYKKKNHQKPKKTPHQPTYEPKS